MPNPLESLRSFLRRQPRKEEEFFLISSNSPLPPGAEILERKEVSGVPVEIGTVGGNTYYYIQEPTIGEAEHSTYTALMRILTAERMLPEGAFDRTEVSRIVEEEARRIADEYGFRAHYNITEEKLLYYVKRDLVGYGPIDVLLKDPMIEDIKAEMPTRPFGIWHRDYAEREWLNTNIVLDSAQTQALATKLAHLGGKPISTAMPIVEVILPDKHRVTITHGTEVSPKGTTISIRKFREKPMTIIHEMKMGTISPLMAAYLWTLIDNKGSVLIIGETGSGKTTLINALAILIRPSRSVTTVEEFPELNLSHGRWQSLVARRAYTVGAKIGEIDLFTLVKTSMRVRPDFLIVGEIVGAESYTLFQSIATGHGGISSFHAESADFAVKRLLQPPISVAPMYISMLNAMISTKTVPLPGGHKGRRVVSIEELAGVEDGRVVLRPLFSWNPVDDSFTPNSTDDLVNRSIYLKSLINRRQIQPQALIQELNEQITFLKNAEARGIEEFEDVAQALREYYAGKLPSKPEAVESGAETEVPEWMKPLLIESGERKE
jgi:flagellar protein FlaI